MKELLEKIRDNNGEIVKISERQLESLRAADPLSTLDTADIVSNYEFYEEIWPEYEWFGVNIVNTSSHITKIPDIDYKAEFVAIGADLPTVGNPKSASVTQRRVGFTLPVSRELIESSNDRTIIGIVKAGIHAINLEIIAELFRKAINSGTVITETGLSRKTFIALQKEVGEDGRFFGDVDFITESKKLDVMEGLPLAIGNVSYGQSWDGVRMNAALNLESPLMFGYGNFRHSTVVEYEDYQLMIDKITGASKGDFYLTFSRLIDTGITDPEKFAVSISSKPIIKKEPTNRTSEKDRTVVFTVQGIGVSTYQWKKDGVDIVGGTSERLVLNSITSSDSGSYTCVLTNGVGSTTSSAATLTVT